MKIRLLLLALASAVLLAGCVTPAGYGYRGDGYYHGGTTIQYRYGRGYPYGYYNDYYPYGYGPGYGYRYGYPYRYDRYYYGYPRHGYPRPRYPGHGHSHHGKPPSGRPPSTGGPPWRGLDRLRPPSQGHRISPPATVAPRATVTPPRRAPATRPAAPAGRKVIRDMREHRRGPVKADQN